MMPKNDATEQRVVAKTTHSKRGGEPQKFIEIREWWYKDGPTGEPIPTRKGILIHRDQMPRLILSLVREINANELTREQAADIREIIHGYNLELETSDWWGGRIQRLCSPRSFVNP